MNKKQVNAFLKFMPKDGMRTNLEQSKLIMYGDRLVLSATEGHILALIYVECDEDDRQQLVDKTIAREELDKWYKLATGKSRLDTQELLQLVAVTEANGYKKGEFPDIVKVVPDKPKPKEPPKEGECELDHGLDKIKFNADYAKLVQEVDGGGFLELELVSKLSGMTMRGERGTYVIMPMK